MPDPTRAQELKAEGNALFVRADWDAAYLKYAAAIQHDEQNAILYANRAACATNMGRFAEAKADAQKAVTLDPTYAKGWGRLATACNGLLQYKESVEYWKKAIAALPAENLTAPERRQKEQYTMEMKAALERAALMDKNFIVMGPEYTGRLPWDRVKAMEADMQAGLPASARSSAWVMLRASKLWDIGIEEMKEVRELVTPQGTLYAGCLGVVAKLTNALLTDARIFRFSIPEWVETYNKQMALEETKSGAWPALSTKAVKAEALKRQQQGGWHAVRPAIDITVRAWIMQGFSANRPGSDKRVSVGRYDAALELLEWGNTASWKDASMQDKGEIFETYFARSVRQLRLEAMMGICGDVTGTDAEDAWQRLYNEARSIIDEMPEVGEAALPAGKHEPGFVLAFGVYPKAHAFTMVGRYHHHMGRRCSRLKDYNAAGDHIFDAHNAYYDAARLFPQDDEKHAWFLTVSLQMLQLCGGPFEVVLRLTEEIRLALPEIKKIWEHSIMSAQGRDAAWTAALLLEQKIEKDLADGKIKRDGHMMPGYSVNIS